MSVIMSIANLFFTIFNLLIIFFMLMGILDEDFLEDVLEEKTVGILIFALMVICYDILSNNYFTGLAAIIFTVLVVSKESRDFICLTEHKSRMPQYLLTLLIMTFGVIMFIANFLEIIGTICRLVDGIIHIII